MGKLIETIVAIVVAVGVSGALFVGANVLFDLAPKRWSIFSTLIGGAGGFALLVVLWGNQLLSTPLLWIVAGTVLGAAMGFGLSVVEDARQRLAIGTAGGVLLGLSVGLALKETVTDEAGELVASLYPEIDVVALIVWTAVGVLLGAALWAITGRKVTVQRKALVWGGIGWLFGAFATPTLGGGSKAWVVIALVVGFGLYGAGLGSVPNADARRRDDIDRGSRKYIFLAPALIFIFLSLVIPTTRTVYLSFLDRFSEAPVGFANFWKIFTDPTIFKISDWTEVFGSRLFWIGAVLAVGGLVAAKLLGRQTGHAWEWTGASAGPLTFGVFLLAFGILSVLRGTIFNNLWWAFAVVILATSLGLAIAVLADRSRAESVAKSIIFLPMAISFVGAGIIWRFMYIARPETRDQTGVLNSIWRMLGELSNSSTASTIASVVLGVLIAGLAWLAWRGYKADVGGVMIGSIFTSVPLLWFLYRLTLGSGLGGAPVISPNGEVIGYDTIIFLQEPPFNNVWLMVVLIWIQTGFTMVIFSAAIKGVPAELIEAAKVDGATENQTFWRVIIPQISSTIGVVTTTLIVLVMKVFDIVKVMTNGNFDTQVLANEMWQRAFTELDFGLGSAVATVLFLSVVPVMYVNIRRMQKAAA